MKKVLKIFILLLAFGCNSSILDDPSTTISFSIPEPSHVKLTIENSYNTTVAELIDQDMSAGSHIIQFNASNLAEGIYFYNLEITGKSGNVLETNKRMLLIK